MTEWTDAVRIAIDVLLACVIIGALVVVSLVSHTLMNTVDSERAASAEMQDYRVQRMYDNAECYAQDIVSLVLQCQGQPAVTVQRKSGGNLTWTTTSHSVQITSAAISEELSQTATYICTLSYDGNGELSSYNFREV